MDRALDPLSARYIRPSEVGPLATCVNGTRVKGGAPSTIWFLWSTFLAWLVTHFSRLGTIIWVYQPDAPIDVATLCATEPAIDPFPSAGDWALAVAFGNPAALRTVTSYLVSVYTATLWNTVCECIPTVGGTPGASYDSVVLSDSPVDYWPFHASGQPQANAVRSANTLNSGSAGSWQTADSICGTGWWSLNPTSGYDWGSLLAETISRSGPWSMELIAKNDGAEFTIFDFGDTGGGLNNVGLVYKEHNVSGHWAVWQGGVTWGDTGQASTQLDSGWHHIVWTYNGATYSAWVDGVNLWTFATGHGNIGANNAIVFGGGWINHGYFTKPAVYNYVLDAGQIAAHFSATCSPGPVYLPPPPGNPPLPDYPATTCSTIGDLCTLVQRIQRQIELLSMNAAFTQTVVAPTGYSNGTPLAGLTGSSTHAVSDIVGVRVVASIPATWGRTRETPPRTIPKYGAIEFGTATSVQDEHQLHYTDQLVLNSAPFSDVLTVSLGPDVTATITPLQRLK